MCSAKFKRLPNKHLQWTFDNKWQKTKLVFFIYIKECFLDPWIVPRNHTSINTGFIIGSQYCYCACLHSREKPSFTEVTNKQLREFHFRQLPMSVKWAVLCWLLQGITEARECATTYHCECPQSLQHFRYCTRPRETSYLFLVLQITHLHDYPIAWLDRFSLPP